MPIEELRIRFDRIKSRTVRKKEVAGAIIAAGAFTLFFGGTALDASVSGILAVAICFCKNKLSRYFNNVIMFNFIIAFIAGSIIYILGSMVDSINVDKVIIGDIMLMIPGISIATSMKDMLSGDTIAGTLRLIECILWAGALAAGFMFAMLLTGGLR